MTSLINVIDKEVMKINSQKVKAAPRCKYTIHYALKSTREDSEVIETETTYKLVGKRKPTMMDPLIEFITRRSMSDVDIKIEIPKSEVTAYYYEYYYDPTETDEDRIKRIEELDVVPVGSLDKLKINNLTYERKVTNIEELTEPLYKYEGRFL